MWCAPFCCSIFWAGGSLYLLIVPTEKSRGCSSCGAWWRRAVGWCSSIGMGGLFGVAGGLTVAVPTDFAEVQKSRQDAHQWWWSVPAAGDEPNHWWPVLLATVFTHPPSIVLLLFAVTPGFSILLLPNPPEATPADASSTQRRIASLFNSARVASLLSHNRNKPNFAFLWTERQHSNYGKTKSQNHPHSVTIGLVIMAA